MRKLMTVGELIDNLSKFDKDLPVASYVEIGEDMDEIHKVRLETRNGKKSYCKGDHVLDWYEDIDSIVIVG